MLPVPDRGLGDADDIGDLLLEQDEIQLKHYQGTKTHCNAQMTSRFIKKYCKLDATGNHMLELVTDRLSSRPATASSGSPSNFTLNPHVTANSYLYAKMAFLTHFEEIFVESIAVELVVIFFLILANGFFAGSELAIISARKSTISRLVAEGNSSAMVVEKLQNDPHRFLATVQIGVTVVGSMASAVGGAAAVEYFKPLLQTVPSEFVRESAEPISIAMVVALVSYFSLILGELAPKTIGLQFADRMALIVAKPINAVATIGAVAVKFLTLSNRLVLSVFGVKPDSGQEFVTREEVLHAVAEGGETGALTEHEHKVIENMLDFSHTQVSEIMVPRLRIVALDIDLPRDALLEIIRENMYTRYPVYQNDRENIVGFIHSKDLFLHPLIDSPEFTLDQIVRTPLYVPESKRANDLLREMQRKRMQIALVVDEYGCISGLVTTEDLLEELVGEIEDEHDAGEMRRAERLADGSLILDALMSLNDLEELLDVKFEEGLPYDTIAGLILAKLGRFPEQGEKVEWEAYDLLCEEVSATSIVKIRIVSR